MDFSGYTEEDFIFNESFQNWALQSDADDMVFWEAWIKKHPEKKAAIEFAKLTLLQLSVQETPLSDQEVTQEWKSLQQALSQQKGHKISESYARKPDLFRSWYSMAAVFIAILFCSAIFWWSYRREKEVLVRTDFGQTATVHLPDGSQIILNGNTSLQYARKWSREKTREVWLDGEAYFSVRKQKTIGNARFIVHTPDLDVEVLGTQFNVSRRSDKTRVVLNEGRVQVNARTEDKQASMVMHPGELVEFSSRRESLFKKHVNPEIYSSWKNKKLIFDNTSMQEVAEMIESTYGLQVHFTDSLLADRKLSGVLPTDNIDMLLLTLSKTFNIDMEKTNNQLLIKPIAKTL